MWNEIVKNKHTENLMYIMVEFFRGKNKKLQCVRESVTKWNFSETVELIGMETVFYIIRFIGLELWS